MKLEMTEPERREELATTLDDLQQDVLMLRLMLRGLDGSADPLALQCLLRVSDYLDQHIWDVCALCPE